MRALNTRYCLQGAVTAGDSAKLRNRLDKLAPIRHNAVSKCFLTFELAGDRVELCFEPGVLSFTSDVEDVMEQLWMAHFSH